MDKQKEKYDIYNIGIFIAKILKRKRKSDKYNKKIISNKELINK